jgi:hypothetical protein
MLSTFDGRWAGTYLIAQCAAVSGPGICSGVGEKAPMDLTLTQTGSGVSGTAHLPGLLAGPSIPVSGTVVNGTLTLTGHVLASSDRFATETVDVIEWGSTLDPDGRIQGTFRYKTDTTWGLGPRHIIRRSKRGRAPMTHRF